MALEVGTKVKYVGTFNPSYQYREAKITAVTPLEHFKYVISFSNVQGIFHCYSSELEEIPEKRPTFSEIWKIIFPNDIKKKESTVDSPAKNLNVGTIVRYIGEWFPEYKDAKGKIIEIRYPMQNPFRVDFGFDIPQYEDIMCCSEFELEIVN